MGHILTAVSNSAPNGTLVYNDIFGALLAKKTRRKTMGSSHHGKAHYVQKASKQAYWGFFISTPFLETHIKRLACVHWHWETGDGGEGKRG